MKKESKLITGAYLILLLLFFSCESEEQTDIFLSANSVSEISDDELIEKKTSKADEIIRYAQLLDQTGANFALTYNDGGNISQACVKVTYPSGGTAKVCGSSSIIKSIKSGTCNRPGVSCKDVRSSPRTGYSISTINSDVYDDANEVELKLTFEPADSIIIMFGVDYQCGFFTPSGEQQCQDVVKAYSGCSTEPWSGGMGGGVVTCTNTKPCSGCN